MELLINSVTSNLPGDDWIIDLDRDVGHEPPSPDDVRIAPQLEIGPASEDWTETFRILVATPNNIPSRDTPMKVLRLHRYSFEALKEHLKAAVKTSERDSWEECLEELRKRFLWEYDFPNRPKQKG